MYETNEDVSIVVREIDSRITALESGTKSGSRCKHDYINRAMVDALQELREWIAGEYDLDIHYDEGELHE